MLVYEAHNELSRKIGDPVDCNSLTLVDGVRYTAAIRDSYLTRAMQDIQRTALSQVAMMPKEIADLTLQRMFPNSMSEIGGIPGVLPPSGLPDQNNARVVIADITGTYYVYNTWIDWRWSDDQSTVPNVTTKSYTVSVPILTSKKAITESYSRTTHKADVIAVQESLPLIATRLTFYNCPDHDRWNISYPYTPSIVVNAMCLMAPVDTTALGASGTIQFDDLWLGAMLNKAALYAQFDSQEMGAASQAYQLLEPMAPKHQQQQGEQ